MVVIQQQNGHIGQTGDVWLFYEIVEKVKQFRAEDQGEKDASDSRD